MHASIYVRCLRVLGDFIFRGKREKTRRALSVLPEDNESGRTRNLQLTTRNYKQWMLDNSSLREIHSPKMGND